MGVVHMGGQRGQHKSDHDPHSHGGNQPQPERQLHNLQNLCDNGRQAGAVNAHIDISGERSAVIGCIETDTRENRPDIYDVLAEQRKAQHQKAGRDGMSAEVHSQGIDSRDAQQAQNPGVDQGRPDSPDDKIVGDEKIRFPDNIGQPLKNLCRRLNQQPHHNKIKRHQCQKSEPLRSGQQPFFKHRSTPLPCASPRRFSFHYNG